MLLKHKGFNFQFVYRSKKLFVNCKLLSCYCNLQHEELHHCNRKSPQKVLVQSIINSAIVFSWIFYVNIWKLLFEEVLIGVNLKLVASPSSKRKVEKNDAIELDLDYNLQDHQKICYFLISQCSEHDFQGFRLGFRQCHKDSLIRVLSTADLVPAKVSR